MNANDEFYVGWETRAQPNQSRFVRRLILAAVPPCMLLASWVALTQSQIGGATFDWNRERDFAGQWLASPVPQLQVFRPDGSTSDYLLVAPWKHGVDPVISSAWDRTPVRLRGKLIYRDGRTMIEVIPGSIRKQELAATSRPAAGPVALGEQSLIGEIVDSKCHLGVMNPGQRTTHRACAVRCISGGIPPILLVPTEAGSYQHYLLVGSDGRPLNREILDLIAEPVRVTGNVVRQGEWLVLRTEPARMERL